MIFYQQAQLHKERNFAEKWRGIYSALSNRIEYKWQDVSSQDATTRNITDLYRGTEVKFQPEHKVKEGEDEEGEIVPEKWVSEPIHFGTAGQECSATDFNLDDHLDDDEDEKKEFLANGLLHYYQEKIRQANGTIACLNHELFPVWGDKKYPVNTYYGDNPDINTFEIRMNIRSMPGHEMGKMDEMRQFPMLRQLHFMELAREYIPLVREKNKGKEQGYADGDDDWQTRLGLKYHLGDFGVQYTKTRKKD